MSDEKRKVENFNYFFLRGAPARSGTNWVSNLLNLHPEIFITGEFNLDYIRITLDNVIKSKKYVFNDKKVIDFLIDDFENLTKRCIFNTCISKIRDKPDVKWLGDRTPVRINPILINKAPHFLIYRDGRDILVSLTYHHLRLNSKESLINVNYPKMMIKRILFEKNPFYFKENPEKLLDDETWVKDIAWKWNNKMTLNKIDLEKIKMGHINARVHPIKYEKLHSDTEGERKKMYEFLDLDPKKALPLDDMTKPGFDKENPTSHYRKGIVGDWKNYFTDRTCEIFKKEAGQKLIDLNYEVDNSW